MDIKILGTGCAKCQKLEQLTRDAVASLGLDATIDKVTDPGEIAAWGVMSTPALVVDDRGRHRRPRAERGRPDRPADIDRLTLHAKSTRLCAIPRGTGHPRSARKCSRTNASRRLDLFRAQFRVGRITRICTQTL